MDTLKVYTVTDPDTGRKLGKKCYSSMGAAKNAVIGLRKSGYNLHTIPKGVIITEYEAKPTGDVTYFSGDE